MKQNWKRSMVLLLALGLLLTTAAGCGGGSATADAEAPAASAPAVKQYETADDAFVEMSYATTTSGGGSDVGSGAVYQDPNAKLIREANLRIQTTEFEQAVSKLDELVVGMGGYFQNASLRGGNYRNVNANRSGDYTIRIPAEQYDSFMAQTGDLGYVTSRNETTDNIGEQYYDTEARLKTQKTKQERLLSLLEKAENMEDIISLETALSDVEYEIERLSSTLNRYDSLVGFSTVYLTLDEVHKVSEETGVTNTLGQRMAKGFSSSVEGLIDGAQDLLVWVSYNVFGLLVAAVLVVGGASLAVKVRKKRKRVPVNDQEQNQK